MHWLDREEFKRVTNVWPSVRNVKKCKISPDAEPLLAKQNVFPGLHLGIYNCRTIRLKQHHYLVLSNPTAKRGRVATVKFVTNRGHETQVLVPMGDPLFFCDRM